MAERSCKNKQEGAMVKDLCLENYQAAANSGVTKTKTPKFTVKFDLKLGGKDRT